MRKSRNVKSLLAELDRREAEIADIEARVVNLHSRYQSVWSALSNDRPLSGATKPPKGRNDSLDPWAPWDLDRRMLT